MTEQDHGVEEADPALASLLAAVRGSVEERPIRRGNFAEAVARAHRVDPTAVPAAMVEEAAALALVVALASARAAEVAVDPELDAFVADVRASGEMAAAERRLVGIPALVGARPGRRWLRAIGGLSVAAAALVLVVLGADPGGSARFGRRADAEGMMARALADAQATSGRAQVLAAERAAAEQAAILEVATSAARGAVVPAIEGGVAAEVGAIDVSDETGHAEKVGRDSTRPARRAPPEREAEAAVDPLTTLDAAAQQRWREGDLKGAEALFREIIRRDRSGRWTHLAYGDLFVLVRERGDHDGEEALWREYLGRHPNGPHADDASAGLCRRAGAGGAAGCWLRYLEQRPTGAYRRQAARWLEEHAEEAP